MTPVSASTPPGRDGTPARDRRPPVGTAARSAAKGVYHAAVRMTLNAEVPAEGEPPPHSGSFLPPARGGLCRPEVGVPVPARRSARWRGAERRTTPALGVLPAARLRRAVPTRGRRSRACLSALHGGVEPRGEPPPHSGSFPAARPPGGLCRPEVGVPLPACRSAWWRGGRALQHPRNCTFMTGRVCGQTRSCGFLPVGPRTARCSPAKVTSSVQRDGSMPRTQKSPPGGGCHGERRLPLPVGSRSMVAGVR